MKIIQLQRFLKTNDCPVFFPANGPIKFIALTAVSLKGHVNSNRFEVVNGCIV